MEIAQILPWLAGGGAAGAGAAWLLLRARLREERRASARELQVREERIEGLSRELQEAREREAALHSRLEERGEEVARLRTELGRLEERLRGQEAAAQERMALLERAREELKSAFEALSARALERNNRLFLDLAEKTMEVHRAEAREELEARRRAVEELARPIKESLSRVDARLEELERARQGAYTEIREQIRSLVQDHLPLLHRETQELVKALRRPQVRGRWGEIQLRRVVELAGMVAHCDFQEQKGMDVGGGTLRPDLVVHLPGGRRIVVDAKTPLHSYLDAVEGDAEGEEARLREHAANVKRHVDQLSRKEYWEGVARDLGGAPEFVIMFIPGEAFFSAALQAAPDLLEYAAERGVVLATPVSLISVLKAVAHAWRQEALAENAQRIAQLGRELYRRITTLANHWSGVGKGLKQAVEAYNRATGSLESRVLVEARRFVELKAAPQGKEIPNLEPLEVTPRRLQKLTEEEEDGG